MNSDDYKSPQLQEHPFCLKPEFIITDATSENLIIFKSAMAPIKITSYGVNLLIIT